MSSPGDCFQDGIAQRLQVATDAIAHLLRAKAELEAIRNAVGIEARTAALELDEIDSELVRLRRTLARLEEVASAVHPLSQAARKAYLESRRQLKTLTDVPLTNIERLAAAHAILESIQAVHRELL